MRFSFSLITYLSILVHFLLAAASNERCYIADLCRQNTSYSFNSGAESIFMLPSDPSSSTLCVALQQGQERHRDSYCLDTQNNLLVMLAIEKNYSGLVSVQGANSHADFLAPLPPALHYMRALRSRPFSASLHILRPLYGLVSTSGLHIEVQSRGGTFDQLRMRVRDFMESLYPPEASSFVSEEQNIEPGSWFIELSPLKLLGEERKEGFTSVTYVEFVLSPQALQGEQVFVDHATDQGLLAEREQQGVWEAALFSSVKREAEAAEMVDVTGGGSEGEDTAFQPQGLKDTAFQTIPHPISFPEEIINVCIWSSNSMDGQKRIWLQQTEFLDRGQFSLTWILSLLDETLSTPHILERRDTVLHYLLQLSQVNIVDSPFNNYSISKDEMGPEFDIQNEEQVLRLMQQLFRQTDYKIADIGEKWVREPFEKVRDLFVSNQCHVVVYGNNRGFCTDFLITDVARSLNIPTVTELLNLYMSPEVTPDVIVAPSHYALQHVSIQQKLEENKATVGIVVQPGVDLQHFHPLTSPLDKLSSAKCPPVISFPTSSNPIASASASACVNVGFIGRLSMSKNLGLYVQTAHFLRAQYPLVHFTVIGSGDLEEPIKELVDRLEMSEHFTFRGFVNYNELPGRLTEIDIIVNPSLRGWSETFCIANIEVMAMQIPLVTFAVGGIGEYVQSTPRSDSPSNADFTVTDNAVVVHKADPITLANATLYLLQRPGLRKDIGLKARESIARYFTLERQMEQYERLYRLLYFRRKSQRNVSYVAS